MWLVEIFKLFMWFAFVLWLTLYFSWTVLLLSIRPKGREFILLKFVFLTGARTIIDIIFICLRESH